MDGGSWHDRCTRDGINYRVTSRKPALTIELFLSLYFAGMRLLFYPDVGHSDRYRTN